jgi:hypothetical protein
MKQLCESSANAPESLFIAACYPVNKKQPFRRTKIEKTVPRDHERSTRMQTPPSPRRSGGSVVGSMDH